MKRRRKHRLVQCTLPQASAPLSQWYREPYGRRLLRETEAALGAWIARAVGYYALDIRAFESHARWFDASLVQSHFALSPVRQQDSRMVGDLLRLPFEANSLDLVVAHHVLEFCADPHEFLREVDRTLIPEGRVIIVGFNPFGAPGLLKWFKSRAVAPWGGHFYPASRVREWFTVLGFDVEKTRYFAFPFAPPPPESPSASPSASPPPASLSPASSPAPSPSASPSSESSPASSPAPSSASSSAPSPPASPPSWVPQPSWARLMPFCGALYALLAVKRVSRMVTIGESWTPKKVLTPKEMQPTTLHSPSPSGRGPLHSFSLWQRPPPFLLPLAEAIFIPPLPLGEGRGEGSLHRLSAHPLPRGESLMTRLRRDGYNPDPCPNYRSPST